MLNNQVIKMDTGKEATAKNNGPTAASRKISNVFKRTNASTTYKTPAQMNASCPNKAPLSNANRNRGITLKANIITKLLELSSKYDSICPLNPQNKINKMTPKLQASHQNCLKK